MQNLWFLEGRALEEDIAYFYTFSPDFLFLFLCVSTSSVSPNKSWFLSFFFFFSFFSLWFPQLLTLYFYSPLVFTITLLFQVNVIYMFCAFSLHFAPSWDSPSSVFCQRCCWWHCLNSNAVTQVDSKLAWLLKRYFIWKQNQKVIGVGRDLWRSSSPTPLLKQVG